MKQDARRDRGGGPMRDEARYSPDAVIGAFGHVASAIAAGGRRDAVLNLIASSVRELVEGDLAGVALRLSTDGSRRSWPTASTPTSIAARSTRPTAARRPGAAHRRSRSSSTTSPKCPPPAAPCRASRWDLRRSCRSRSTAPTACSACAGSSAAKASPTPTSRSSPASPPRARSSSRTTAAVARRNALQRISRPGAHRRGTARHRHQRDLLRQPDALPAGEPDHRRRAGVGGAHHRIA